MKAIDRAIVEKFVDLAAQRLSGDFVIIGGAVLSLLGIEGRTTVDIDVAGPKEASLGETLKLFEIAEGLGLPPEAINQAGAFFLHRIEDYERHLVLIRDGPLARIYRPDATLFILLKVARLTERDLEDCLKVIEYARKTGEVIEVSSIKKAIERIRAQGGDVAKEARIKALLLALSQGL